MVWSIPLASSGHLSSCAPSQLVGFFAYLLTGRAQGKGKREPLITDKHYLAKLKPSVCYQHHSYSKSKTQPCNSYWEEINSTPAVTRTASLLLVFVYVLRFKYSQLPLLFPKSCTVFWGHFILSMVQLESSMGSQVSGSEERISAPSDRTPGTLWKPVKNLTVAILSRRELVSLNHNTE